MKKVLHGLKDSSRTDCLNALSEAYMTDPGNGFDIWGLEIINADSAMLFAQKALEQAEKINYIKGKAKAYYNLGGIGLFASIADFRTIEQYQRTALASALQTSDKHFIGCIYGRLGVILWYQSKFVESIESLEKAEQHFQKTSDKKRLAVTYRITSTAAWQSGYYEKSLQYAIKNKDITGENELIRLASLYQIIGDYETALNLFRSDLSTIENYLWMGEIFVSQQLYDSAKYYYEIYEENVKDETNRNKVYSHLGDLFLALKEYDIALTYLNKALNWHRKVNDGNSIMWELVRLANTYKGKKNYVKAREAANELLNMAKETGARQYLPEAHFQLYSIFEILHQKDSAFFHLQQYTVTKEIIDKDLSAHKLAFYKNKSERELAQSRIDLLNKEKQVQQAKLEQTLQQRKFLFAGIAALLLFGIIFIRNILLKRKNEKHLRLLAENELQMQTLESEKTNAEFRRQTTELEMQALRAQMNPHFIFNSLNSINRFILQNERLQASEYLTTFSKLTRMILQNSQAPLISLENELEALKLYLELEAVRFDHRFGYKISVPEELDIGILKVPPLIIQPFTENAIWHGLMHLPDQRAGKEEKGQLEVEVNKEGNYLYIKIADNGIGRKKAAELTSKSATKHKSMGLRITNDRIAMLQKSNGLESPVKINDMVNPDGTAAGTEVIIKMPVLYD